MPVIPNNQISTTKERSMFLQFHFLTNYTGVLLNRDDVGFAKRLPLGNATRTRVSSQCLKRHWRTFDGAGGLHETNGAEFAVRSRRSFDKHVRERLVADGVDAEVAAALTAELLELVLGMKPKEVKEGDEEQAEVHTGQVTVLGPNELEYLYREAKELVPDIDVSEKLKAKKKKAKESVKKRAKDRDWKKNLGALKASLDVAMHGRMVTGDVLSGMDAAIHVAHAFTVHSELSESDYFSAIDDLMRESGETGSGHINSQELTSGLFYGYVVVDAAKLVANISGMPSAKWRDAEQPDVDLAADVVRRLVKIIATVSPGAKLGSTAPYARAEFFCVEATTQQPRSLANAFLKSVETSDVRANAYGALARYVKQSDEVYGFAGERRFLAIDPTKDLDDLGEKGSLDAVAGFAADQVLKAAKG